MATRREFLKALLLLPLVPAALLPCGCANQEAAVQAAAADAIDALIAGEAFPSRRPSWQLDWAENPDLLAALFRVR